MTKVQRLLKYKDGNRLMFNFDPDTKTGFLTYAMGTKTYLQGPIREIVKELWHAQCQADDIDPTSQFVVFSDDNPITPLYQHALSVYLKNL